MSGSNRVASGIFASRAAGLLREIVLGAALGISPAADAFRTAMRVPNLLQNLLGEGSISAAFVPVYARLVEDEQDDEARTLAGQALGLLSAVVVVAVALIVIAARPLVWLTTFGGIKDDRFDLAVQLTRITAVGLGFLVISAWCLGILNAHRRYRLSYSAPVLWSVAQIAALSLALILGRSQEQTVRLAAFAVVAGSLLQLGVQLPSVRRLASLRPSLGRGPAMREVLSKFAPAVGGRGVVQIGSYIDLGLAGLLAYGALATIGLIMPLYLIPIAVFGFSVAVSELTEMSRERGGDGAVAARVRMAERKVLLPAGLITAGALGGGAIVIESFYEQTNRWLGRGDFSDANTTVMAATLAAFAIGLPATMTARVKQNALYALGDVKGPARIAIVRLVVAVVVGFIAMLQLDHLAADNLPSGPSEVATLESALDLSLSEGPLGTTQVGDFPSWPPWEPLPQREQLTTGTSKGTSLAHFGPVGLGLGSAVASWVEWQLLRRRLRARLLHPISGGLGLGVAIAAFATFVTARLIARIDLPPIINLLALGVGALGVYLGTLWFIGLRPRSRR